MTITPTPPDYARLPSEEFPLGGWRVVITRAAEQAESMATQLQAYGAEPIYYPTIAFAPPEDYTQFDAALHGLVANEYDWLVLTSANGVRAVQQRLAELDLDFSAYAGKLAVVGPATATTCHELLHRGPAVMPEKFVAEYLADALGDLTGQRVLIATADLARAVLPERLTAAGAIVNRVTAYRTVAASGGADVPLLLSTNQIDVITFTSGSAATYFVERIGAEHLPRARQTIIACIGPIAAKGAEQVGLSPTIIADPSTTEGLIAALVAWRHTHS